MHVILLRKCKYSDRYRSIDSLFEGEYTLDHLLSIFPTSFFLVINEEMEYYNNRVVGRNRLKEILLVDPENQIRCANCGTKNLVTRKYCRKCGFENKYYEVTKYLSEEFNKSVELREFIDFEIWKVK